MLHLGHKVRFAASELNELKLITGPCFFEPKTVNQLNTLCAHAQAFWLEKGDPRMAEAVGNIKLAH